MPNGYPVRVISFKRRRLVGRTLLPCRYGGPPRYGDIARATAPSADAAGAGLAGTMTRRSTRPRPPQDEAIRHRDARGDDGRLRRHPGARGPVGLDRLRAGDRRGGDGGRGRRLVRGDGAVPPPAGHPDPAHRDHPETQGPASGASLGDFVAVELPVRAGASPRSCAAAIARRVGKWLVDPTNARTVARQRRRGRHAVVTEVLRDEDVQDAIEHARASGGCGRPRARRSSAARSTW